MTYQQMFEEYYKEFSETSEELFKIDRELSQTNGFGNMRDIPEYNKAYIKWQVAANNYNSFLANLKGKTINPNDEFVF